METQTSSTGNRFLRVETVKSLLASEQFLVLYPDVFKPTWNDPLTLAQKCDHYVTLLELCPLEAVPTAAALVDSLLLPHLPGGMVRQLLTALLARDKNVMVQMPNARDMINLVANACELSFYLAPSRLMILAQDLGDGAIA